MNAPRPDDDLVRAVRAGDRDAFDLLARRHVPRLVGAARAILRDPDRAEEAVADALLKVHGALSSLRDARSFPAWAHAIVCRVALDRLRGRRREPNLSTFEREPSDPRSTAGAPLDRLEAVERLAQVRRAVDRLPESQRLAVVLHLWEGLSYDVVAELLGTSYDAVRVNLAHARRSLRARLGAPAGRPR
jgi:RNA polymerase sigma-70 factor (ECF subfamily)